MFFISTNLNYANSIVPLGINPSSQESDFSNIVEFFNSKSLEGLDAAIKEIQLLRKQGALLKSDYETLTRFANFIQSSNGEKATTELIELKALQYWFLSSFIDALKLSYEMRHSEGQIELSGVRERYYSLIQTFREHSTQAPPEIKRKNILRQINAIRSLTEIAIDKRNHEIKIRGQASLLLLLRILEKTKSDHLISEAISEVKNFNFQKALSLVLGDAVISNIGVENALELLQIRVAVSYLLNCNECKANRGNLESIYGNLTKAIGWNEFQQHVKEFQKEISSFIPKDDTDFVKGNHLIHLFPSKIQEELTYFLNQLRNQIPRVKELKEEYETLPEKMSFLNNHNNSANILDDTLILLSAKLKLNTDINFLKRLYFSRHVIQHFSTHILDSSIRHSSLAMQHAHFFQDKIQEFILSQTPIDMRDPRLHNLWKEEADEAYWSTLLSRETLVNLGMSALAIYQLGTIPGWIQKATCVTAPFLLRTSIKAGVVTAGSLFIGNSAINLIDRIRLNGTAGLLSVDTLLDVFILFSTFPRVNPFPRSFLKDNFITLSQYQTGSLLQWGGFAYSIYLFLKADQLSAELVQENIHTSPEEIKRKALMYFALGCLAGIINKRYYNGYKIEYGQDFTEFVKKGSIVGSDLSKIITMRFRPFKMAREFYDQRPGLLRGIASVLGGISYATYGYYLLPLEVIYLSYLTADNIYLETVEKEKSYPILKDHEVAVSLIGFDEVDVLLDQGSQAINSNFSEKKLYGNRFIQERFDNPENLIHVLKKISEEHGPIRFLKVMVHGLPGHIVTKAVDFKDTSLKQLSNSQPKIITTLQNIAWSIYKKSSYPQPGEIASPDVGLINTPWLQKNKKWLQDNARTIFAPDARIVFFSCLIGTNIEVPSNTHSGDWELIPIGDDFLRELGNSLLVNGGRIDASNRALIGISSVFGSGMDTITRNSLKFDRFLNDPTALSEFYKGVTVDEPIGKNISFGLTFWGDVLEHYTVLFGRYLTRMPKIIYNYGIKLEGGWNHNRYKHIDVAPH